MHEFCGGGRSNIECGRPVRGVLLLTLAAIGVGLPCTTVAAEQRVKVAMRDGMTVETYYKTKRPWHINPFTTTRPGRCTSCCR